LPPADSSLPAATPPAGTSTGTTLESKCAPDGRGSEIKKIEAVDNRTVVFTLCRADPDFRYKIALPAFGIESPKFIQASGGTGDLLNKAVGTGPYMFDRWSKGDSLVFKRFDGYWGDKAKAATLIFRWATHPADRLLELQSGTVDAIDNPAPDDFEQIRSDSTLQLLDRPALNVLYLGFTLDPTNQDVPWAKKAVRQAIAIGIDRERIVKSFYPAGSEVADYFTPCAIVNGCVGDRWYKFDSAVAKQMLSAAGYPNGFTAKLYYRDVTSAYLPEPGVVAQDIQSELKENLGISVTLVAVESSAYLGKLTAGGYKDGLHLYGWEAGYPTIKNALDYHFSRNQRQFGSPYPNIYGPLEQGAPLADPVQSKKFYSEANNAIRAEVPLIPIVHGGSATAYKADVRGAQASPADERDLLGNGPRWPRHACVDARR
jgi:peptide/nickel transport system substrate-binding protein